MLLRYLAYTDANIYKDDRVSFLYYIMMVEVFLGMINVSIEVRHIIVLKAPMLSTMFNFVSPTSAGDDRSVECFC